MGDVVEGNHTEIGVLESDGSTKWQTVYDHVGGIGILARIFGNAPANGSEAEAGEPSERRGDK